MRLRPLFATVVMMSFAPVVSAQTAYLRPPKAVTDVLDAPAFPSVSVSPARDTVALVQSARFPTIAEVAEPMLRLAGLRINPRTNGPAKEKRVTGLTFVTVDGGKRTEVKLPEGRAGEPIWSHDGKRFALTVTKADGIELWAGTVADGEIHRLKGVAVNAAVGEPVQWLTNGELLVQAIPEGRGKAPTPPLAPVGPVVQESGGKAAPVRTYQDMLQNAHDEVLFAYHATSQLAVVAFDGKTTPVGEPGIFTGVDPSPSLKYMLVTKLKKPFSYLHPYSVFPKTVEVWNLDGKLVHTVADLPLQDHVPIEGVPTGPRGVRWIPRDGDALLWVEALDGGDPKAKVPFRDELFLCPIAEKGDGGKPEAAHGPKLEHRFSGINFFPDGKTVLLSEYDRDRKWTRTTRTHIGPGLQPEPAVVFDRSVNDRYGDPGAPLMMDLPNGQRVLRQTGKDALADKPVDRLPLQGEDGRRLFLSAPGASPKGDFPALRLYDPPTKKSTTLFQCREGVYESVVEVLDDDGKKLFVRRESPTEPPNYFVKDGDNETALTDNKDPFPELRKVTKQLLTTKRKDGVAVSFTLYVPAGVKEGEKLPTVFWAYPKEFNDAATAGQVSGSPNRYTAIGGYSHLFFLTQGYAVMDEVSMPIVGTPEAANDTFIDQLVMTAEAAIDKACEAGPVDRGRIGIGGHSYGAFMTANLLAHSDLFRAGIARSGAYNRTLTPFGFQNERRTFWEAPAVYAKMSPFNAADKVNEPLLMIHGQADSNPGTFPVQSERMYQAVRGTGGTARLVLLPHEDHAYAARESVEHVLAEQIAWFDKHVKAAKPRAVK